MTYRVGSRSGRPTKDVERERLAAVFEDDVGGVLESKPLHHRTRPHIARLGVGHNLIGSQLIKGECQAGTADLGRIAMAPARAEEGLPDLEPVLARNVSPRQPTAANQCTGNAIVGHPLVHAISRPRVGNPGRLALRHRERPNAVPRGDRGILK